MPIVAQPTAASQQRPLTEKEAEVINLHGPAMKALLESRLGDRFNPLMPSEVFPELAGKKTAARGEGNAQ